MTADDIRMKRKKKQKNSQLNYPNFFKINLQ